MKKSILIIVCILSIQSFAQTDIIELRSRNASLKKYARARSSDGDHVTSNFGILYEPTVQTAVLDSVKCISETKIVMYTSNCSSLQGLYGDESEFGKWQPGADTVENHPLFRHRHRLDSVKMVLDRDYYFNLPADSVKFIGFDNGEVNLQKKGEIIDAKMKRVKKQRKSSMGWPLLFVILGPIAIAYFFGHYLIPKIEH